AGLEHRDRVAEGLEFHVVALEDAGRAEHVVVHPGRLADVDDEPAVGDRGETRFQLLDPRLLDHGPSLRRLPAAPRRHFGSNLHLVTLCYLEVWAVPFAAVREARRRGGGTVGPVFS